MLVHCAVKYGRPPDLKSSSNVSLQFAWIKGPATDPSLHLELISVHHTKDVNVHQMWSIFLGTISLVCMVSLYCLLKSSDMHEAGPFPLKFKENLMLLSFSVLLGLQL